MYVGKYVYIVWLKYPGELKNPRLSAIFNDFGEAKKYAERGTEEDKKLGYTCEVTTEKIYETAEEV